MLIINSGDPKKSASSFHFSCSNCGCEWMAERKEVSFNPPCLSYGVYMKCPNCKKSVDYKKQKTIKKKK